jgi:hypothetical protein
VPKAHSYEVTMYIMACLLVLGFICNLLVRPVDPKHHMTEKQLHEDDIRLRGMPRMADAH